MAQRYSLTHRPYSNTAPVFPVMTLFGDAVGAPRLHLLVVSSSFFLSFLTGALPCPVAGEVSVSVSSVK